MCQLRNGSKSLYKWHPACPKHHREEGAQLGPASPLEKGRGTGHEGRKQDSLFGQGGCRGEKERRGGSRREASPAGWDGCSGPSPEARKPPESHTPPAAGRLRPSLPRKSRRGPRGRRAAGPGPGRETRGAGATAGACRGECAGRGAALTVLAREPRGSGGLGRAGPSPAASSPLTPRSSGPPPSARAPPPPHAPPGHRGAPPGTGQSSARAPAPPRPAAATPQPRGLRPGRAPPPGWSPARSPQPAFRPPRRRRRHFRGALGRAVRIRTPRTRTLRTRTPSPRSPPEARDDGARRGPAFLQDGPKKAASVGRRP
ncbi:DNA-3-methyladenine glycosylase isoform X1 [Vulpes vulpes]|uniref:DNA-3-methyladenine glycosylase isoform X1 n=1 Tax=Vulpes vulpes TaxID=9627 RepID=A0ABM5A6K1_VULVU